MSSVTPNAEESTSSAAVVQIVKPKSARTYREVQPQQPPQPLPRRPQTSDGVQQSTSPTPLSLWRDSQTVQAYLGTSSTITKLPSPSSWANRTAASFALSQSYSSGQKSSQSQSNPNHPQDKEEIMELKRQLAHATQDLHLTKSRCRRQELELLSRATTDRQQIIIVNADQISRSLSTGNGSAVMAMISPTSGDVPGAPGSPYRASSGTALNSAPKPSLSKELMQKLRSMTETIKMLSDENAQLRTQNEEILRARKEENAKHNRKSLTQNGLYDDLDKKQLVELVVSYDDKLKSLSSEVLDLQKKLKLADEATKEAELATVNSKSSGEKDKYKQLARRLKEERNTFRDNLEAKQKEQADLKVEMEKMSELISELRINCQTLQSELSEARSVSKDRSDVAVQANINVKSHENANNSRKSSTSSITQESIRKARSVYGAKQPKPVRSSAVNNSMSSLHNKETENNRINSSRHHHQRSNSMSPAKAMQAKIVKPVARNNPSKITKPTKLPSPASISNISSTTISTATSPRHTPSRIPQPDQSGSPRKSRIPSAPRYITPNRYTKSPMTTPSQLAPSKSPSIQERPASSVTSRTSSPPPPPPPTQMREEELINKVETPMEVNNITMPSTPVKSISESPALPPVPPASRVSKHDYNGVQSDENDDECSDEDEEILRVTTDGGNVEITSTKTDDLESPESPIIPSVIGEKTSYTSGSQNSGSGSENENPSADDERSRDGDRQRKLDVDDQEASSSSNLVDCTPRTRKKVEHFRQGLAARRIQRTWKHFYEELEERKEVRDELPAPLVQVIGDKAKLESAASSPTKKSPEEPSVTTIDKEAAINTIEESFLDHSRRERALAGLKAKIHTARPWQKKKSSEKANEKAEDGSSEEELERAYRALHMRGNDIRAKVSIIKADAELFTNGKVSEMRAKLNEQRRLKASERSDGITEDDDDEDVVY